MATARLIHGECLQAMVRIDGGSVDAVVTDPPAGIAFMGQAWDHFPIRKRDPRTFADGRARPGVACGQEFRPGGRDAFVAFLTPRLEEARKLTRAGSYALVWALPRTSHWTALAIEDAGWTIRDRVSHLFGTGFPKSKSCLKPACEDWWLAWNPAPKVKALSIEASRILGGTKVRHATAEMGYGGGNLSTSYSTGSALGRWPANVTHDGSDEVMEAFDLAGPRAGGAAQLARRAGIGYGSSAAGTESPGRLERSDDSLSAARFFYCAKASKQNRGDGNRHPTVKNTALMRWLVGLITRPGDTVLDPFAGSGSTGVACLETDRSFIGIERDGDYFRTARGRLAKAGARFTKAA